MTIYWKYKALKLKKITYRDWYHIRGLADLEAKIPDGNTTLHFLGGKNIPVECKTKQYKTLLKNDKKWTNVMNRGNSNGKKNQKGFANNDDNDDKKNLPLSSAKNR